MRNEYAKRQRVKREQEIRIASEIVQRWTAQLCLDVMTLVLNDPEIMGKDVFGPQRLKKLGAAFNAEYAKWVVGLSPDASASYVRDKLDERLQRIWGAKFEEWKDRYYLWEDKEV